MRKIHVNWSVNVYISYEIYVHRSISHVNKLYLIVLYIINLLYLYDNLLLVNLLEGGPTWTDKVVWHYFD